jgi:YD repeat-containing protein
MRSLGLLALAGCWRTETTPPPAPKRVAATPPVMCPLAMHALPFIRHELFLGCTPPQFPSIPDLDCGGACPTPCEATLDATPNAGFKVPHATFALRYEAGRYVERTAPNVEVHAPCLYDRGLMVECGGQRYRRDANGRLDALTYEDGTAIAFHYDRGKLVETMQTDPDGFERKTLLFYDGANRVVREQMFQAGGLIEEITYKYRNGRLATTALGDRGTITYAYDGDRLVTTETKTTSTKTTYYEYDAKRRPSGITLRDTMHGQPMEYSFTFRYCD